MKDDYLIRKYLPELEISPDDFCITKGDLNSTIDRMAITPKTFDFNISEQIPIVPYDEIEVQVLGKTFYYKIVNLEGIEYFIPEAMKFKGKKLGDFLYRFMKNIELIKIKFPEKILKINKSNGYIVLD